MVGSVRCGRSLCVLLLALAVLLAGSTTSAQSEKFPSKPVRAFVGFPQGGATDQLARALDAAVRPIWGQPLEIVNVLGGGGTVATAEVVRAPADGYSIMVQAIGAVATQPHILRLPYTFDDMAYVMNIGRNPAMIVVRADSPFKTVGELIEAAKRDPDKIRVAVTAIGSLPHINAVLLFGWRGATATFVPISAPDSVHALLNGRVEALIAHYNDMLEFLPGGRIRIFGVFSEGRSPDVAGIPTLKEQGFNITGEVLFFIVAPKRTPEPIRTAIHDAFRSAIATPGFRAWARKSNFYIDYLNPQETEQRMRHWHKVYGDVIRVLGLRQN